MINTKPLEFFPKRKTKKVCGECTACCEGFLNADLTFDGVTYKVRPETPCPMIHNHSCKVYNTPLKPTTCDNYSCMWLDNLDIPDYMRPDRCKVILTEKKIQNISYIQMIEMGKKVDSSILAEVIQYAFFNSKNLEYVVDGKNYHLGSPEFMNLVLENINKNISK